MWEDAEGGKPQPGEPNDPPQPSAETKPSGKEGEGAKDKGGEDLAAQFKELQSKFVALEKKNQELADSERYWADLAQKGGNRQKPEPEPEPDDDDDDLDGDSADKQVEDFSTEGVQALVRRGLLTKKEAKEIIRREARKIAEEVAGRHVTKAKKGMEQDAQLLSQFPELQDESSELFKATREIYRGMVQEDPELKKSPGALKMAAKLAKKDLELAAKAKGDTDREDRIKRQGENGRHRSGGGFGKDEDDENLSPGQKAILAKFNADGGIQVSEEAYAKRAKEGVRMSTNAAYQSGSMNWEEGTDG